MNEEELLNKKELREKLKGKVEILNKVGNLLLLSKTNFATTQQVANYYDVDTDTINVHYNNFQDELISDGVKILTGKETKRFLATENISVTNKRGYFVADNQKFANSRNILFPKRAILRIGMLLRDSPVAKEVRTQLLNTIENSTDEEKIHEITKEKNLLLNVIDETDNISKALALNELKQYYDRNKKQLENALDNQSKLKNSKKTYINQADFGARFNRKIGAKNIGKLFQIVGLAKKTYHRTTPYEQYVPKYAMNVVDNEISKKYDVAYVWSYNLCISFIDKWLKNNGKYDIFYSLIEKEKLNEYINELYDEIVLKPEAQK